jgi:hypothetical protein
VDTAEKSKLPPWKKGRWWAVAVVFLLLSYPALLGPLRYCDGRGWTPPTLWQVLWAPFNWYHDSYLQWWMDLAWEHEGRPFGGM